MVFLCYILCLRYTILTWNPRVCRYCMGPLPYGNAECRVSVFALVVKVCAEPTQLPAPVWLTSSGFLFVCFLFRGRGGKGSIIRGCPTRMVYLHYISCLRYTILVRNHRLLIYYYAEVLKPEQLLSNNFFFFYSFACFCL